MPQASRRPLALLCICAAAALALVLAVALPVGPAFVPYVPVMWDGDRFVERRDLLTDQHKNRFLVFTELTNEVRLGTNGEVLIARSLAADQDLLSNYTKKAEDLDADFVDANIERVRAEKAP